MPRLKWQNGFLIICEKVVVVYVVDAESFTIILHHWL